MKAEIAGFHSPDIDDLRGFVPIDQQSVGFLLQVMVGPAGTGGYESFDVQVCTPAWLMDRIGPGVVQPGSHTLLISEYDWEAIEKHIQALVAAQSADDWHALASKLDQQLGRWEFADYRP